jgi:hypothetical protein
MQRRQRHEAATSVDAYLDRVRAEDREALRGGVRARRGRVAAGIRREPRHRVPDRRRLLDCTGQTIETGKVAGTDLRDGTPTLPLILAAEEDEVVYRALAGWSAGRGAGSRGGRAARLERSRDIALDFAERARTALDDSHRKELEAIVTACAGTKELTLVIRLGRISYVNMAPVFFRLDAEADEVQGVPRLSTAADRANWTSRRSLRSSTRRHADRCASCRGSAYRPRAPSTRSSSSRRRRSSTSVPSP